MGGSSELITSLQLSLPFSSLSHHLQHAGVCTRGCRRSNAEHRLWSPAALPHADGRNSSIHAALDSFFLNRPASTDVLSDILASVSDARP